MVADKCIVGGRDERVALCGRQIASREVYMQRSPERPDVTARRRSNYAACSELVHYHEDGKWKKNGEIVPDRDFAFVGNQES